VTRMRDEEDGLLRFVADPEKRVVPDLKRKLPGRGVWITATRDAVAKAVRQKVFARGFRQAVEADATLAEAVEVLLRRAALQDLALANKAGCVVAGFAKVEKALNGRKPMALLHASDAAGDGRRKLDRLALARTVGDMGAIVPVGWFTSTEVSAALGRENVMHAAIENGGAGQKFLWSAERFRRYVGTHPGATSVAIPPEQDKE
jgi:predicted RNA-binding protein YlxR (DUF448 family)